MEKITREEALAKVAEVLEEALAEYEALEKMETTEGAALAKADAPPFVQAKKEDDQDEEAEEAPAADDAGDDSDEEEENGEDKDEEDQEAPAPDAEAAPADEESDDELQAMKKAIDAKLEKRGLLKTESKTKAQPKEMKKSETTTAAPADDLRKSVDERFDSLTKTITSLAETVNKIAAQPAQSRKGVAGYAPLKKNEEGSTEGQPLNKAVALDKLLDLKKSGDKRVTTALINRLETGRMSQQEFELIKGLLA